MSSTDITLTVTVPLEQYAREQDELEELRARVKTLLYRADEMRRRVHDLRAQLEECLHV